MSDMAKGLREVAARYPNENCQPALLAAAADEVDRLRAELGTQARVNKDLKRAADVFLDEGDRLRAVIKDAPHESWCPTRNFKPCTCWKADAL